MNVACIDDNKSALDQFVVKLNLLGYSRISTFTSVKDFLKSDDLMSFDLVLSDYFFGSGCTVTELLESKKLPKDLKIIVCTNYFEEEVYREISQLRGVFFIKKGFEELELKVAIDNVQNLKILNSEVEYIDSVFFVKTGKILKPLNLNNITHFSVSGKYVVINTDTGREYLIRTSLTEIEYKLPEYFIRVHASYIINKTLIDLISLEDRTVKLGKVSVPYSRSLKDNFFKSIAVT